MESLDLIREFLNDHVGLDPEKVTAEAELAEIARAANMRILGPNCLGAFNLHTGFVGCAANKADA